MNVPAKVRIAPLLMPTVPVKEAPETAPVTVVPPSVMVSGFPAVPVPAFPAGVTVHVVRLQLYTAPP